MDIKSIIKSSIDDKREKDGTISGLLSRADRLTGCFDNTGDTNSFGIPILGRVNKDGGSGSSKKDPNIRTASDFVNLIGNEKSGYLAHDIRREYSDDIPEKVREKYQTFDKVNQTATLSSELMELDAISGLAYSLFYVQNNQVHKKVILGSNACVKYVDNRPVLGLIYEKVDYSFEKYSVNIKVYAYDTENRHEYEIRSYNENSEIEGQERLHLVSTNPHLFNGTIPLIEWRNNKKTMGNAEKVISHIDAYDLVMSDSTTEISQLREAYIMMKNAGKVDDKLAETMRKTGIIPIPEGGDAKFLEKSLSPQYLQEVKNSLEKDIFRFSRIVDSAKLMEINDPRKNQIDFIYRSMDNDCDVTEKQWQHAFQLEDEVLKSFWTNNDLKNVSDYDTYNINYIFVRNKPKDELADLKAMKEAGISLPNYKKLIMLGYNEEEAKDLSNEAQSEMLEALDDDTTGTE